MNFLSMFKMEHDLTYSIFLPVKIKINDINLEDCVKRLNIKFNYNIQF